MSFSTSDLKFPYHEMKTSLKPILDFSVGAVAYLFALSMFFYFPGVEAWTATGMAAMGTASLPYSAWICALLVLLVVLPAVFSPAALISRSRDFARPVLAASCAALGGLFLVAGAGSPLLYGRVALLGLLTGQLLALGRRSADSVPFNWMVYTGFILANTSYPDSAILAGANIGAGCYLLFAGVSLLLGRWDVTSGKRGLGLMVG
jgi:hypothetical protein